ncbi:type III secretion outer membrane pore, YscC/HrcC family [Paraburkholderia phytofirmans PsJN]|uniref:Type 3 secretion system secretin n=2 Tax=Paraburkholderia phytofirmans TaxID=261302 RepID=B2TD05_PARPJ|nr:type III secretion outer membrane pore, YscC/HrcC family [Paraburkholderia phytofirmans PsJN]
MFLTRRVISAKGEGRYARRYPAVIGIRSAFAVGIILYASMGSTAEPVWGTQALHYFARNTPLPDVLKAVVSAAGLQVEIARGVKGPVNGAFDDPPSRVFAKLVEAYGLAWYFDGNVIHVSPASDIRSRTIPFAPMTREEVAGLLSSLGLADSRLPVRYSDTTAVVSGPSGFVDAVSSAVAEAQRQTTITPSVDETVIRVFPLQYAQAQDITYTSGNQRQVVPGVASLLRKLMADVPVSVPDRENATRSRNQARAERGGPPPLPSLRGLGLAGLQQEPELDPLLPVAEVMRPAAAPIQRNIVADARTNSVVIYDVPSMMPSYARTIAMLDKQQDLVEITAVVIDITSDAASDLGIHWGGATRGGAGGYAVMNSSPTVLASSLIPALAGLNLATMIGSSANYLFAKIHLLEQSGKARILSRPQVLTLNNSEAILSSRNSLYVRVAGNQDVDLYNVDTGLTLKVTPTVESGSDSARNILLSVQIDDGAFDSSLSVDGIPKVNNHSIVTQAVVADGESLLLGGYEYERSQTASSQVHVLGHLPYVGALFRDTQTQVERLERLILITPRVKPMVKLVTEPDGANGVSTSSLEHPAPSFPSSAGIARAAVRQRPEDMSVWNGVTPPLPPGLPPGPSAPTGQIR